MNNIFEVVKESIEEILSLDETNCVEVSLNSKLVDDLGLKSLDIAQLIAMLEIEFDKDPFSEGTASLANIITVNDLCEVYM
ncbi:MAG: phosphopantetheine-binding protein [Acutalibacteraceae bacterium]|nr:phosphopantetheine-binding protein [Acutalibacteraceae bacterium]